MNTHDKMSPEQEALWNSFMSEHRLAPGSKLSTGQIDALKSMGLGEFTPPQEPSLPPSTMTQQFWYSTISTEPLAADEREVSPSAKTEPDPAFESTMLQVEALAQAAEPSGQSISDECTQAFLLSSAQTAPLPPKEPPAASIATFSQKALPDSQLLSTKTLAGYALAGAALFVGAALFGAATLGKSFYDIPVLPVAPSVAPSCPQPIPVACELCPVITAKPCSSGKKIFPPLRPASAAPALVTARPRPAPKPPARTIEGVYKFRTGGMDELERVAATCKTKAASLIGLTANVFLRKRLDEGVPPPPDSFMRIRCPADHLPKLEGEFFLIN